MSSDPPQLIYEGIPRSQLSGSCQTHHSSVVELPFRERCAPLCSLPVLTREKKNPTSAETSVKIPEWGHTCLMGLGWVGVQTGMDCSTVRNSIPLLYPWLQRSICMHWFPRGSKKLLGRGFWVWVQRRTEMTDQSWWEFRGLMKACLQGESGITLKGKKSAMEKRVLAMGTQIQRGILALGRMCGCYLTSFQPAALGRTCAQGESVLYAHWNYLTLWSPRNPVARFLSQEAT